MSCILSGFWSRDSSPKPKTTVVITVPLFRILAQSVLVPLHHHETNLFLKAYCSTGDGDNFLRRCRPDRSKIKHSEPITVGTVLLVQRHLNNEKVILEPAEWRYRGTNKGVDTVR